MGSISYPYFFPECLRCLAAGVCVARLDEHNRKKNPTGPKQALHANVQIPVNSSSRCRRQTLMQINECGLEPTIERTDESSKWRPRGSELDRNSAAGCGE